MTAPDEPNPSPPQANGNPRPGGPPGDAAASPSEPASGDDHAGRGYHCLELCPICRGAELLRSGRGPEVRGQLDDLGREALLTMRSLIDHYLERLDEAPKGPRVQEIPIE